VTAWREKGYTKKQLETILKMGDGGYSNQAIADRFGRSRQAIEKLRRKLKGKETGGLPVQHE